MRVFITGATGLLGTSLVTELLESGHEVVALVRSLDKGLRLHGPGGRLHLVEGDMLEVERFAQAIDGCNALIHAAAYFREYYGAAPDEDELEEVNVRSTARLFETAVNRGVRRCVFIGSSGCSVAGVPLPSKRVPYLPSLVFAAMGQLMAHMRGRAPNLTVAAVRALHAKSTVTSAKAVRELDASFRPLEQTIRDAIRWFELNGHLRWSPREDGTRVAQRRISGETPVKMRSSPKSPTAVQPR